MPLFRKEAITQQSERLTGTISLAQPLSIQLAVSLLVCIAIIIIIFIFIFNAHYTHKETVRWFLVPDKGVIKSYVPQGSVVEKLMVHEGDSVNKNQPLATMVISQNNNAGIELSSQLITQLNQQKQLINNEIKQQKTLQITETNNLAQQLLALNAEKVINKQNSINIV